MKNSGIIVLVLALILITAGLGYIYGKSQASGSDDIPTVTVQGEAARTVSPDLLVLTFTSEGFGNTTALAQSNASVILSSFKSRLLANGISEDEIETSSFHTYPVYNYSECSFKEPYYEDYIMPPHDCERELMGYKAVHTIKVNTDDTRNGGTLADAVVSDNVQLSYIYFTLTESSRIKIETELEREAAEAAKKKAEGIAEGLGAKIGKVVSVKTEGYYWDEPMPRYLEVSEDSSAPPAETEFFPRNLDLSSTITVVYELRQ
jgi:uncharacterized protein YggE